MNLDNDEIGPDTKTALAHRIRSIAELNKMIRPFILKAFVVLATFAIADFAAAAILSAIGAPPLLVLCVIALWFIVIPVATIVILLKLVGPNGIINLGELKDELTTIDTELRNSKQSKSINHLTHKRSKRND